MALGHKEYQEIQTIYDNLINNNTMAHADKAVLIKKFHEAGWVQLNDDDNLIFTSLENFNAIDKKTAEPEIIAIALNGICKKRDLIHANYFKSMIDIIIPHYENLAQASPDGIKWSEGESVTENPRSSSVDSQQTASLDASDAGSITDFESDETNQINAELDRFEIAKRRLESKSANKIISAIEGDFRVVQSEADVFQAGKQKILQDATQIKHSLDQASSNKEHLKTLCIHYLKSFGFIEDEYKDFSSLKLKKMVLNEVNTVLAAEMAEAVRAPTEPTTEAAFRLAIVEAKHGGEVLSLIEERALEPQDLVSRAATPLWNIMRSIDSADRSVSESFRRTFE